MIFFFHNKFAFGEYIHEHSVVFKVWFVCSRAINKFMLMVFRATRKFLLWYLEQSVNSCHGVWGNKEINAECIR